MQDRNPTARGTDETKNKQQVMFSLESRWRSGLVFLALTSSGTVCRDHSPGDATTLIEASWTRSNPEPITMIVLPPLKYTHSHNTRIIYYLV